MEARVLFLRLGAIGDIIHCLPSLELYKRRNPEISIEFAIANKQVKELLEKSCSFIDKVWLITHQGPFNKLFSTKLNFDEKALLESIKQEPLMEFIYLHSNQIKPWIINQFYLRAKKHRVYKPDRELSAVANYVLAFAPELRSELISKPYQILQHKTLNIQADQKDYICVVPGVGNLRPHRAYPLDKWFEFIRNSSLPIKILGGPDEMELSKDIDEWIQSSDLASRVQNLIGKTSLFELAQILKSSQHLYSADTGILHIASALDIPITSIFTITSPNRFGPFNPGAKVLRSSSCTCLSSCTNTPKHCQQIKDSYASCSWDIDLISQKQITI